MATPKLIPSLAGSWTGVSKLYLPFMEENQIRESASTMTVAAANNFGVISYTWAEDGPQEGTLILIGNPKTDALELAWVDSWHQNSSVLHLKGMGADSDALIAAGEYGPYEGQMWGWRIEIRAIGDQLSFKMFNVAPDGNEDWAVDALYTRVN